MRYLIPVLFSASLLAQPGAPLQTAFIPGQLTCPAIAGKDQVIVAAAVSGFSFVGFTLVSFSCVQLDPLTVSIDKTTTPWTLRVVGAQPINFAGNEVPAGTINGTNHVFTLAHAPVGNSLQLFRNGLKQTDGQDFTLSGNTITWIQSPVDSAPQAGDLLSCSYFF